MQLTFLGATGTVTGSKYLLEHDHCRVLIDCGLFQGHKALRQRNWQRLPIAEDTLDAVVLTHAHIDHSGYLPLLVKRGFSGPIYCSSATLDLCEILLPDSGRIHEEDAERANRYGYSKHKPALPLYTEQEARLALKQFHPVSFGKQYALDEYTQFNLQRVGHILGAACITVSDGHSSIVFSGDLGRPNDPIMVSPVQIQQTDYLVLESTYGDRLHAPDDASAMLAETINRTIARGGTVIIPSFAVGRAQSLLYFLHQLLSSKTIPAVPIYLDSPMAVSATRLWQSHHQEHRLSATQCADICATAQYVQTPEQSKALDKDPTPKIIISASGMATGGRVLHHLASYLGDARNTILFAGYQAGGTRGARLVNGEQTIKLLGEIYPVVAQIESIHNLSAHADYQEILTWLRHFHKPPRMTYLTHGEPQAALALQQHIQSELGWEVTIPAYQQTESL